MESVLLKEIFLPNKDANPKTYILNAFYNLIKQLSMIIDMDDNYLDLPQESISELKVIVTCLFSFFDFIEEIKSNTLKDIFKIVRANLQKIQSNTQPVGIDLQDSRKKILILEELIDLMDFIMDERPKSNEDMVKKSIAVNQFVINGFFSLSYIQ